MKIKNIFLAATAALALVSCNQNYREVSVYDEDYVKTTFSRVGGIISEIYTFLPSDFGNYSGALLSSATDESVYTHSDNAVHGFYNGAWNANNNLDGGRWSSCWTAISYANLFLDKYNDETFSEYVADVNYKAEMFQYHNYQYEARALRAFYYFELVRMFGSVPLITHYMEADAANAMPQVSTDEIFKFIDDECLAIKDVIVKDYSSIEDEYHISMVIDGKSETGRVNDLFVLALRARAAMYHASPLFSQGKSAEEKTALWKAAVDANYDVISLCKERSMKVDKSVDYATAFSVSNWSDTKECIFVRRNISTSNTFEKYNFPLGMENAIGANVPTQNLVNAYFAIAGKLDTDGKPIIDPSDPYAGLDKRFSTTIAVNGEKWPASNANNLETYVGGMNEATGVSHGTNTGYYLKKYINNATNISGANVNAFQHHWVIFRMGEFYLNYAESMLNYEMLLGASNAGYVSGPHNMTAAAALNNLRRRAFGVSNATHDITKNLSNDDFKQVYENERFVELAFEGHRFYDVRRWMEAPKYFSTIKKMEIIKNNDGTFTYTPKELETRNWNDRQYLFPISQSEVMKAGLTQNTGW